MADKNSQKVILRDNPFFEATSYDAFIPESLKARGKYIISRSGLVWPSLKWSDWLMYSAIPSRVLVTIISLASYWRRGRAPVSETYEVGIIHSNWSNGYYHWLTESLPRSYQLIEKFPNATIALPSISYSIYIDSLNAVGAKSFTFFPDEKNLQVENPILSKCPRNFATTDPEILKRLVFTIKQNLRVRCVPPATLIVHVSRQKARGRKILNESELLGALHGVDVVDVCLEDLSFRQQVELMSQTKILIGMHGAGLTNLMFMPAGGTVIEVLPRRNGVFDYNKMRNSFKHDACFIRLAAAFSIRHCAFICEHDVPFFKKTHMANVQLSSDDIRKIADISASLLSEKC